MPAGQSQSAIILDLYDWWGGSLWDLLTEIPSSPVQSLRLQLGGGEPCARYVDVETERGAQVGTRKEILDAFRMTAKSPPQ